MTPANIKWRFQVDPEGIGEVNRWQEKILEQPRVFNRKEFGGDFIWPDEIDRDNPTGVEHHRPLYSPLVHED
ncbi:MAG: hypothetical protein ACYS0H_01105 [Planctomycetota bacterium]|jgi:hypothetical protein